MDGAEDLAVVAPSVVASGATALHGDWDESDAVSAEDLAWEADRAGQGPGQAALSSSAPVLRTGGIEGPLDWIVAQARAGRIDLARLSVLALVEQCASAIAAELARGREMGGGGGPAPSLERPANWMTMASWLVWLRSRLLLPADYPEVRAALDEAEALRRRLANLDHLRAITSRPRLGGDVFGCGRPHAGQQGRAPDLPALLLAYVRLVAPPTALSQVAAEPYRPRSPLLWRVSDAVTRIKHLLPEALGTASTHSSGHREDRSGASLWGFLPDRECLETALAAASPDVAAERVVLARRRSPRRSWPGSNSRGKVASVWNRQRASGISRFTGQQGKAGKSVGDAVPEGVLLALPNGVNAFRMLFEE